VPRIQGRISQRKTGQEVGLGATMLLALTMVLVSIVTCVRIIAIVAPHLRVLFDNGIYFRLQIAPSSQAHYCILVSNVLKRLCLGGTFAR
jgi:hypothetical protein